MNQKLVLKGIANRIKHWNYTLGGFKILDSRSFRQLKNTLFLLTASWYFLVQGSNFWCLIPTPIQMLLLWEVLRLLGCKNVEFSENKSVRVHAWKLFVPQTFKYIPASSI